MLKRILLSALVSLSIVPFFGAREEAPKPALNVYRQEENELESLTKSEYAKLAEALDVTKTITPIDMGNSYKIFDVNSEAFRNAFLTSAYTIPADSGSISGRSAEELASNYSEKASLSFGLSVPTEKVGFDVQGNFNQNISQSLISVNDEYYEYWEVNKTMKIAQIDWSSISASPFLSKDFTDGVSQVKDTVSAMELLSKYGTHVFDNYYFGGNLMVSRYICSSKNISESVEENDINISLLGNISSAMEANANGENYSITSNEINTSSTKTSTKVLAKGGNNLNGIDAAGLFTYKQEYASKYESGYVYSAWLNSIGKCESLRIIKVANPVAIWDVLKRASLIDDTKYQLFEKGFELLSYINYSKNCVNLGIAPGYIETVTYHNDNYKTKFDLNSDTIKLPEKSTTAFEFGKEITTYFAKDAFSLKIEKGSQYCSLENNVLKINENTNGKEIDIALNLLGERVFALRVNVGKGLFNYGYGTKDQPYYIGDLSEWKQFIENAKYFDGMSFELLKDIDLEGNFFSTGGLSTRTAFYGVLDGKGHSLKNGSILSSSSWNNIGITILNSGANVASSKGNINAGVLAGRNNGMIEKVALRNCSLRVCGKTDGLSFLNVGLLTGYSRRGNISLCSVKQSRIYGLSYQSAGKIAVGGLVGKLSGTELNDSYVADSKVEKLYYRGEHDGTKTSFLGALFGFAEKSCAIDFVATYSNTFSSEEGHFGFVAGSADDSCYFQNAYYEGISSKAVDGKVHDGCMSLKALTLNAIGNAEWQKNWVSGDNGQPILGWEDR